jgi:hypothetical protein
MARSACYLGAAAAAGLVAIGAFTTISPGPDTFHTTGDYLLTADGIPFMLGPLLLLPALRTLRTGPGSRLTQAGMWPTAAGATVLLAMFVWGLITADGGSWGPTYPLAVLATIAGVALFAAGFWKDRTLPRWLVVAWPVAWLLGIAPVGPGFAPLALTAVYLVMAHTPPIRRQTQSADAAPAHL